MKRFIVLVIVLVLIMGCMVGCDYEGAYEDTINTRLAASNLQSNQPTPTDLDYSLERYNLIRRAYWVNGQREKANALVCEIEKPLGYIVLFGESGTVISSFVVDGKVSSLNSFLTPDTDYPNSTGADWLADVDGSYGNNDNGIFFFDVMGHYIEWTGTYLYTDIPMEIENPVIKVGINNE